MLFVNQDNSFLQKQLTNGGRLILFKRTNVINFFEEIEAFFEKKCESQETEVITDRKHSSGCKLYKITDEELLDKLEPLLNGKILHTLEAIQVTQNFYKDKYPNMTYKDWSNLIKSLKFD